MELNLPSMCVLLACVCCVSTATVDLPFVTNINFAFYKILSVHNPPNFLDCTRIIPFLYFRHIRPPPPTHNTHTHTLAHTHTHTHTHTHIHTTHTHSSTCPTPTSDLFSRPHQPCRGWSPTNERWRISCSRELQETRSIRAHWYGFRQDTTPPPHGQAGKGGGYIVTLRQIYIFVLVAYPHPCIQHPPCSEHVLSIVLTSAKFRV